MTSNTSTSLHPVPAEQTPIAAKPPQFAASPSPTQSSTLGWAAAKFGACLKGLASPAAGALIITSAFLVLKYKNKRTPKPGIRPIARSMSLAFLHGGEKAIQRFKEFHRVSSDKEKLNEALGDLRNELNEERINFVDLYAKIGIFEMTEKEEEVINLLKGALKKAKKVAKDHQMNEHTQTTHELKLLLAEMLIYKGNYEEALNYLEGDGVLSTADARVPLYKAVIYSLLHQPNTAKTHFDQYIDSCNRFHGSKFYKDAQMHLQLSDFQEFLDLVENIQKEIPDPGNSKDAVQPNQKDSGAMPESTSKGNSKDDVQPNQKDSGATPQSISQGNSKDAVQPNRKDSGATPKTISQGNSKDAVQPNPKDSGATPKTISQGNSKDPVQPNPKDSGATRDGNGAGRVWRPDLNWV